MEQSIKQKKIASIVQEALNEIFQKTGLHMVQGGMMSIMGVTITPDLLIARVALSFYNIPDTQKVMEELKVSYGEIRHQLGNKMKNQVRRIPELEFFKDDSLDRAFRIEELLKKIQK